MGSRSLKVGFAGKLRDIVGKKRECVSAYRVKKNIFIR